MAGGGRNHVSHAVVATVPPCFARPGDLAEAAAHSEFLAAFRAGNLRLVRDDRGWTGWHMVHVRGGDSDACPLVSVQSSKNSRVQSAANVKEVDGYRSAESGVSSYAQMHIGPYWVQSGRWVARWAV